MTRLPSEVSRLFMPPGHHVSGNDPQAADLVAADGTVRALVLAIARPADWQALATAWQGVQADLGWPAPAIAVAGDAGLQLWFSLAQPCPAGQAALLLAALRARYLGAVRPDRITLWPAVGTDPAQSVAHAMPVPAALADGRWSAFVAPDLAPMFVDEPWLDLPPNPDGQADLLARLHSVTPAAVDRALQALQPMAAEPAAAPQPAAPASAPGAPAAGDAARRFLVGVMNDESVDLALRIEAARALLAVSATDR